LNHPFCLFFYSWPRPNRERKLQLTPPGWTYQGRLWFLIYIPCSQNENISREIYMYTHFIYMYWMYWYCMDILFIYIYMFAKLLRFPLSSFAKGPIVNSVAMLLVLRRGWWDCPRIVNCISVSPDKFGFSRTKPAAYGKLT
jgi:hypothetical protein